MRSNMYQHRVGECGIISCETGESPDMPRLARGCGGGHHALKGDDGCLSDKDRTMPTSPVAAPAIAPGPLPDRSYNGVRPGALYWSDAQSTIGGRQGSPKSMRNRWSCHESWAYVADVIIRVPRTVLLPHRRALHDADERNNA